MGVVYRLFLVTLKVGHQLLLRLRWECHRYWHQRSPLPKLLTNFTGLTQALLTLLGRAIIPGSIFVH